MSDSELNGVKPSKHCIAGSSVHEPLACTTKTNNIYLPKDTLALTYPLQKAFGNI